MDSFVANFLPVPLAESEIGRQKYMRNSDEIERERERDWDWRAKWMEKFDKLRIATDYHWQLLSGCIR